MTKHEAERSAQHLSQGGASTAVVKDRWGMWDVVVWTPRVSEQELESYLERFELVLNSYENGVPLFA